MIRGRGISDDGACHGWPKTEEPASRAASVRVRAEGQFPAREDGRGSDIPEPRLKAAQ